MPTVQKPLMATIPQLFEEILKSPGFAPPSVTLDTFRTSVPESVTVKVIAELVTFSTVFGKPREFVPRVAAATGARPVAETASVAFALPVTCTVAMAGPAASGANVKLIAHEPCGANVAGQAFAWVM